VCCDVFCVCAVCVMSVLCVCVCVCCVVCVRGGGWVLCVRCVCMWCVTLFVFHRIIPLKGKYLSGFSMSVKNGEVSSFLTGRE